MIEAEMVSRRAWFAAGMFPPYSAPDGPEDQR
jgi:hypothetical protein